MIKEKGRKRKRKGRGERQGEINEELGLISPGGDLILRYLPQTIITPEWILYPFPLNYNTPSDFHGTIRIFIDC